MASDILIYRATHVPVGEDQKQHLELCRDIAQKFNNDFNTKFFPLTEPLIPDTESRIMSLRDGKKKMSKSDESDFSRINLTDDPDLISQKIKKAKTDSAPIPKNLKELDQRPEALNLIQIYSSINKLEVEKVLNEFGGKNFSEFKNKLADSLIESICPIGKKIRECLNDSQYLEKVLIDGSQKASEIATKNLEEIYDIVGLKKFT